VLAVFIDLLVTLASGLKKLVKVPLTTGEKGLAFRVGSYFIVLSKFSLLLALKVSAAIVLVCRETSNTYILDD
jgi:hypothetical protein